MGNLKGASSKQQVKSISRQANKYQKERGSSRRFAKTEPTKTKRISSHQSHLNDPSLVRDLVSRGQFVALKKVYCTIKLV